MKYQYLMERHYNTDSEKKLNARFAEGWEPMFFTSADSFVHVIFRRERPETRSYRDRGPFDDGGSGNFG